MSSKVDGRQDCRAREPRVCLQNLLDRLTRREFLEYQLHGDACPFMPKGGRYWHYRYRFQGREKLLSLGCYPDVSMESAGARHHAARQLLALGVDPAGRRKALRPISGGQV